MAVQVLVLKERAAGERRVAATPETIRKLVALGASVWIEPDAGRASSMDDAAYQQAGAQLAGAHTLGQADVVLCVQGPPIDVLLRCKPHTVLIGMLSPDADPARAQAFSEHELIAFPLERLPRTTRAQSMDVLSSQAGMAGYKAMLIAAQLAPRFFPMLTTAAGTMRPCKVLVIGAGVAGLQAIATAKRLGAQVEGFDVRPETREQIASLGALPGSWRERGRRGRLCAPAHRRGACRTATPSCRPSQGRGRGGLHCRRARPAGAEDPEHADAAKHARR